MSAIVGLFGVAPGERAEADARAMLSRMGARGGAHLATWSDPSGVVLGVAREAWELGRAHAGNVLLVETPRLVMAADASLYDREALHDALRAARVEPAGDGAAHLLAAAFEAWGERCIERLEGDFAFVLWDRRARRAILGRDLIGRRPLHACQVGDRLLVASTASGVAAHPACPRPLNIHTIGAAVSGLLGGSRETAWEAVQPCEAGTVQAWQGGATREAARWEPPAFAVGGGRSDDAVAELRGLLVRAVGDRLSADAPSTVWLSGGWDSTAVFASARRALEERGAADGNARVRPLSLTFPEGDLAREDHFIDAVAARWHADVTWIDTERLPLFDAPERAAAERDDPYAHTFEQFNRTLAERTVGLGARVALDGHGGDQLFQVSRVLLADLLASGRWVRLAREWRAQDPRGFRTFFRWAVRPRLGPRARALATRLRGGRPLGEELMQDLAPWLSPALARDERLTSRARSELRRRPFEGAAAFESRWYLTTPYMSRAVAWAGGLALSSGVEVRSPLLDRRLIRFAAGRPVLERSSREGTKVLLRRAMREWLPDEVLATRPRKTGIPRGWFHRRMREEFRPRLEAALGAGPFLLAELGIVEPGELLNGLARYERAHDHITGVQLFLTLQSEYWLRARDADVSAAAGQNDRSMVAFVSIPTPPA